MNIEKKLKHIIVEENTTMKNIAEKLKTSPQNLSQKIKRETIHYKDMNKIAELLGYEIVWKKKNKHIELAELEEEPDKKTKL